MTTALRSGRPLDGVIGHIRQRVGDYFPGTGPVREIRVVTIRRRAYSDIYHLVLVTERGPAHGVIIKFSESAQAQFQAMASVWPSFAAQRTFRIPRPLDCLPDGPALIMEAVSGTSLQSQLPWLTWAGQALRRGESACHRAGQWLRFYHDLGGGGRPVPFDVDEKWTALRQGLHELRAAGFRPALCQRIEERMRPLAERVRGRAVEVSHVHGDFTADNVLLDGARLTVVDLWATHRHAVHHDLASFVNSLLLLRLSRPAPWAPLRRLRAAFLDGYFGVARRDEALIALLQGTGLVDTAYEIVTRHPSATARGWLGHFLIGAVDRLARALDEERP